MSTSPQNDFDTFRSKFQTRLLENGGTAQEALTARTIFANTHEFLSNGSLITNTVAGMESLQNIPTLVINKEGAYEGFDADSIDAFLDKCKVSKEYKPGAAMEMARILTGKNSDTTPFYSTGKSSSKNQVAMEQIYGPGSRVMLRGDAARAMESFGEYSDRVTSDSRLAVALTVLRAHKSLVDRALPRRAEEDPVVIIKIPSPEVYNLALSQNPVAAVRYDNNRQPLISLYRDPTMVNTQPQQIIPLKTNDNGSPAYLVADGQVAAGVRVNLFDMTLQSNTVGFTNVDWTDLVSDGGQVGTVYVTIVRNVSGTLTTEVFALQTQFLRSSYFTTLTNVEDSGDRGCNVVGEFALTAGALMANGSASAILSAFTSVNLDLKINFNASLNIKTSFVEGSGAVAGKLSSSITIPGGVTTTFTECTFSITGWAPLLYFSEENMRKTTAAIRMNWKEQEFLIPVGRNFIVDYSLMGQTIGEDVMNVVNNVIDIGNSARAVNIIQNTLTQVGARLAFEATAPEITYYQSVAQDFAAGTLSLPHVYVGTIDCSAAAVMRESERLSDLHAYFASRIMGLIADGHNKSMYTENFEAGERARYKVITSGPIGDLLFGADQYWNTLDDKLPVAEDSDYSIKLANGTRLDIIKSNFKQFADLMLIFPIREAKPDDVTSFATNLDRGTFVGQYTPVSNGAANKRIVANSREIAFPTNPLGYVVNVAGISAQLEITVDGAGM